MAGHESANARHQHSAEDSGDAYRRVELITGRRRRRDWTPEEKAEIVSASLEPGRTVTEVAARYQVSRGLLWNWRRGARDALAREVAPAFVPLRVANRNHRRLGSQSSDSCAQNHCNGSEGPNPQSLQLGA
jgi:transposase